MTTFPEPSSLLPHRAPFLFVDAITELTPGISASAIWKLTGNETFFEGHFPGRPTLPGVLMCEAIAQTLELSATISRMSARAGKGAGVARVNGEIACECDLLFVVVDA